MIYNICLRLSKVSFQNSLGSKCLGACGACRLTPLKSIHSSSIHWRNSSLDVLVELFEEEGSEVTWLDQEHGIFMINYRHWFSRTYLNLVDNVIPDIATLIIVISQKEDLEKILHQIINCKIYIWKYIWWWSCLIRMCYVTWISLIC